MKKILLCGFGLALSTSCAPGTTQSGGTAELAATFPAGCIVKQGGSCIGKTIAATTLSPQTITGSNGSLVSMNFSKSKFPDNVRFERLKLLNANFSEATLNKANFNQCALDSANFQKAKLSEAHFSMTTVTARYADFRDAALEGATIESGNFRGAFFQKANLNGLLASGIQLDGAKFDSAKIGFKNNKRPDFSASTLVDAHFENAVITGANFAAADLSGANMKCANMQNNTGQDTNNTDFSGAVLDGATLHWADLSGAVLTGQSGENEGIRKTTVPGAVFCRTIVAYDVDSPVYDDSDCLEGEESKPNPCSSGSGKKGNNAAMCIALTAAVDCNNNSLCEYVGGVCRPK
jgi:uncharacterized protein YjbI with pentapeptide repeats